MNKKESFESFSISKKTLWIFVMQEWEKEKLVTNKKKKTFKKLIQKFNYKKKKQQISASINPSISIEIFLFNHSPASSSSPSSFCFLFWFFFIFYATYLALDLYRIVQLLLLRAGLSFHKFYEIFFFLTRQYCQLFL